MSDKQSRKTFRHRLEEMISKIREQILSGHYAVGDYLPSELDLSTAFQLSNNSIRKGLDVLVAEGLVEKIPRVGNRVKAPDEDAQTVIRFGYHPILDSQTELPSLLAEFQRKHPHIRVQTVQINNSQGYVRNFLENELIDLFTVNYYLFQDLVENALDLLEPQEPFEEMYPFLRRGFVQDGVMYAQPFVFSPVVLCYNREHFSRQQVPEPDSSWTWDDLLHNSSKLAIKNEQFGFYFHLVNQNRWVIFLLQSGAAFEKDEKGRYRVQGTKLLDGIEKVREILYTPEVYPLMLSASNADAERLFRDEQVSVILTTYFAMNQLKDVKFEFDVAPIPYLHNVSTLLVTIGLSIHRQSKVKSAAKQLVEFLVSEEAQRVIRRKTYTIPANKQMSQRLEEMELNRPSRYQMYKEIIPSFRLFTETNLTLKQLDDVLAECKLYWSGLRSKESLAKNLEQVLNREAE
ncbi:extracellular solute-binding protein [Paenibacillus antri]|uniref:Extracellular solute-binding protein n=1 Tax=Paenibacillus antri TaxID=2582848 RepID=A0A5R9GE70_9BACL|nr:extracellular solute-binding protein [Paenibacillus antri]TLS54071.1 extracellular solute-binding protein [Paenibacillus antri]